MIQFDGVSKTYDSGVDALDDVTLTIDKGEFVFIVGPSGAGKSTFIKLLLRELTPTKGAVHVNGYDLNQMKRREIPAFRRPIGVVFQDFRLIPTKTVFENVAFRSPAFPASTYAGAFPISWTCWVWRAKQRTIRRRFPAASSSGSPWPGRW